MERNSPQMSSFERSSFTYGNCVTELELVPILKAKMVGTRKIIVGNHMQMDFGIDRGVLLALRLVWEILAGEGCKEVIIKISRKALMEQIQNNRKWKVETSTFLEDIQILSCSFSASNCVCYNL